MTVPNDPLRSLALRGKMYVPLRKGAIEFEEILVQSSKFYSTYFLVLKKDGSFHPNSDS